MEARYVGVDVSKDRLDVHVLPDGAAFAVARDGKGLAELVERKMLVAIAAARKLLTILNAIVRDKQPWRSQTA